MGEGYLWGPVAFSAGHWVCFTRKWAIVYWYCHVTGSKNNSRTENCQEIQGYEGKGSCSIQERSLVSNSYDEKVNWVVIKVKTREGSRNQNGKPLHSRRSLQCTCSLSISQLLLSLPGEWSCTCPGLGVCWGHPLAWQELWEQCREEEKCLFWRSWKRSPSRVWVGRDLKYCTVPPSPWAGTPSTMPGCSQPWPWALQGWKLGQSLCDNGSMPVPAVPRVVGLTGIQAGSSQLTFLQFPVQVQVRVGSQAQAGEILIRCHWEAEGHGAALRGRAAGAAGRTWAAPCL